MEKQVYPRLRKKLGRKDFNTHLREEPAGQLLVYAKGERKPKQCNDIAMFVVLHHTDASMPIARAQPETRVGRTVVDK